MSARDALRDWTPPPLLRLWRRRRALGLRWEVEERGWEAAVARSRGYDDETILERVARATEQVVRGDALFERDSVVFHEREYPFALLAVLLDAALRHHGTLNVVDFGGSLGSKYWQCRPMLRGISQLQWCVVEQAHFVRAGQRIALGEDRLAFSSSLDDLPFGSTHAALASSVLQYLPDPAAILAAIAATGAEVLVIDRTPVCDLASDVVCVQHVPPSIYPASYPCRIFSRSALLRLLAPHWSLDCDFDCPEGWLRTDDGLPFEFRGFVLRRKP